MIKQKFRLLIPLVIIAGLLLYSWATFLFGDIGASWQHYVAIGLFSVLVFLLIKNYKSAIIATGLYLLLGTFAILSLTPEVKTAWLTMGPIQTPPMNLLSLGLFILFFILNYDQVFNIYWDYKATQKSKK